MTAEDPAAPAPCAVWDDYVAAAQRLDAVRREAASVVAEHAAAAKAARVELTGVRQQAAQQRSRLIALAKTAGVPAPDGAPAPAELAAAERALGATDAPATPATVTAALHDTCATLGTTEAILSTMEGSGTVRLRRISTWPVAVRNPLVYLGFALVSVLVPLITFQAAPNKLVLIPTIGCAATLPILGYGLAWVTVGMLYRPEHTGGVRRTPFLGAAVTVGSVVFLYTLYLVLAVVHTF